MLMVVPGNTDTAGVENITGLRPHYQSTVQQTAPAAARLRWRDGLLSSLPRRLLIEGALKRRRQKGGADRDLIEEIPPD